MWLIKLLWFQGWHRDMFDPWESRPEYRSERPESLPHYASLSALADAAILSEQRVFIILANLENRGWLTRNTTESHAFSLREKPQILETLCECFTSSPWRSYRYIGDRTWNDYLITAHYMAVNGLAPSSGAYVMRERSNSIYFYFDHFEDRDRDWPRYRQRCERNPPSRGDHTLPLVFHHSCTKFIAAADFTQPSIDDFCEDVEPCDADSANVFIIDSSSWPMSIGRSISRVLGLSVDLLQCYLDHHTLGGRLDNDQVIQWVKTTLLETS